MAEAHPPPVDGLVEDPIPKTWCDHVPSPAPEGRGLPGAPVAQE